jgi:hypothetical protein
VIAQRLALLPHQSNQRDREANTKSGENPSRPVAVNCKGQNQTDKQERRDEYGKVDEGSS